MQGKFMQERHTASEGLKALFVIFAKEPTEENAIKLANEIASQDFSSAKELKYSVLDEFRKELSNLATKEEVSNLRDEVSQIRFEMSKFATKDKLEVIKAELEKNLGDKISDTKDKLIKWVIGVGVSAAIISISSSWILFTFLIDKLSK